MGKAILHETFNASRIPIQFNRGNFQNTGSREINQSQILIIQNSILKRHLIRNLEAMLQQEQIEPPVLIQAVACRQNLIIDVLQRLLHHLNIRISFFRIQLANCFRNVLPPLYVVTNQVLNISRNKAISVL